ncbi:MAG TPA: MarC family protein [Longimicrobiales bacterium]|nr:MarC family protein [Longimicrobiales bacterium]
MAQFFVVFVAIFSIVNPFAAIPVYVGLTSDLPPEARRRLPRSTALAAFVILTGAYLTGQAVLAFFSISLPSLRVAGGVLIFSMAWSMLQAKISPSKHHPSEAADPGSWGSLAVMPLAMPLLSGPGAISVMILHSTNTVGLADDLLTVVAAGVVALSIWAILSGASPIASFLGTAGMNVATRLMGLILAAMAVEFIVAGLGDFFPVWTMTPGGAPVPG